MNLQYVSSYFITPNLKYLLTQAIVEILFFLFITIHNFNILDPGEKFSQMYALIEQEHKPQPF